MPKPNERFIPNVSTWDNDKIYVLQYKTQDDTQSVYFKFDVGTIRIHKKSMLYKILLYQPNNTKPVSCIYNSDNPIMYAKYMAYCINYLNDPIASILDNIKIEKSSALFDTLDRLTHKQYI
jgi:hypothetical protein